MNPNISSSKLKNKTDKLKSIFVLHSAKLRFKLIWSQSYKTRHGKSESACSVQQNRGRRNNKL